ncbi:MAG TPA: hypothetical protein VJA66_00995 [Thermoanaerobaculia bacterium]
MTVSPEDESLRRPFRQNELVSATGVLFQDSDAKENLALRLAGDNSSISAARAGAERGGTKNRTLGCKHVCVPAMIAA